MKSDELDHALTDALHRRAAAVHAPEDGRVRFDQHIAADARHRHRRRVAMSVVGVAGVMAVGAGAIAFANGRTSHPDQTVASGGEAAHAATDQIKLRAPSAPSGLPKMLPTLPAGWALESASDYAPAETDTNGSPITATMLLFRSADGAQAIRVDIATDPNGSGFDPNQATGDPNSKVVTVHGFPALVTVDPKGLGIDLVMWAEGPNTTVTVTGNDVAEDALVAFAESLQPAAEGWSAFPAPAGLDLVYSGDPNAPMGYAGPSWQLGYRGPEDLTQPQDPSISVTATKGTIDSLTVFPGPSDRPVSTNVGDDPGVLVTSSDSPPYRTIVWFDEASGLVLTINASGISEAELQSFANSFHSVSDDEWQRVVADVLPPAGEPSGPVEPPVPTQPDALGTVASGALPDGHPWTISATRYRDDPDANTVCGDLSLEGSSDVVATACMGADGAVRPGLSAGTDNARIVFGALPVTALRASVEQTGGEPIAAAVVASGPADVAIHWFIAVVPDVRKVSAVVGLDDAGNEVARVDQPFGAPYPDYELLERAAKRQVASGTVDGAAWTLTAADAPLSDGSGRVTCVTLTFASESAQTCPVVAAGGVNGNGFVDAVVAILRKRSFLLAHLDPDIAKVVVDLDDGTTVGENVVDTGSASGSKAVVVRIPDGRTAVTLHAWDTQGQERGAVDISALGANAQPMPFAVEDSRSARPAGG